MAPRLTAPSAIPPNPRLSRGKVLLAVEAPEDLEYYRTILDGLGYKVLSCRSFAQASSQVRTEVFDLVVVSQGTRQFEGRAVLESAMQIDRRIPVVVLARYLDMRCYLEAMQLGAVDYLAEPLTMLNLGHVLRTHLRAASV